MGEGIDIMIPPYREGIDRGFDEVMRLAVMREESPLYWVQFAHSKVSEYLGYKRKPGSRFNLTGRQISAAKLYQRLDDNNPSFSHLRCDVQEDLITILLNEKKKV